MNFEKILENKIEKQREKDKIIHKKVAGKYSPSTLSSLCMRQKYFAAIADEVEFPMKTLRIFEMGNLLHEFASKTLKDEFESVEVESRFLCVVPHPTEHITISGRIDSIVKTKESELLIVEFKSIYNLRYVTDAPKPEHVAQLQLYLGALSAKSGYIIYIEKQSLGSVTHEVKYDHAKFMKLLDDVRILHEYVVAKKVPPFPASYSHDMKSYPCSYCNFKNECAKIEKDEETAGLIA